MKCKVCNDKVIVKITSFNKNPPTPFLARCPRCGSLAEVNTVWWLKIFGSILWYWTVFRVSRKHKTRVEEFKPILPRYFKYCF